MNPAFRWIALRGIALLLLLAPAASPVRAEPSAGKLVSDGRVAELEREAVAGSAEDVLELALAYDERGDSRAADAYRRAAAQGVGVAELRLGALHETGKGVPQSYEQARFSYERAVALGVAEANLRLGLLYLDGWGVARDPARAARHIELAAGAGYVPAQQVLADMLFSGVGVPADPKQALHWAERAAATHDPAAQAKVGAIHQSRVVRSAIARPEDLQQAREWYQLSAQQDYSRGMLQMAGTFFKPGADPESIRIGLKWLELAADSGNAAAAFHLAGFQLWQNGGEPAAEQVAAARRRLQQAAEAHEAAAIEVLELEKGGRSLAAAFRYVRTVPYDDRYVQHMAELSERTDTATTRRPRPLRIARPIFPAALRLTETTGEALIEFIVDTTGRVREAHPVRATHPAFGELAAAAVRTWWFQPGMKDGNLVRVRMQVPVYFRLSDVADPERPGAPAGG